MDHKRLLRSFATLVVALAALCVAAQAGDDAARAPTSGADQPPPPGCRVALIPARRAWIERQVTIPPVTEEVRVPVYETVKVPVYGTLTWTETELVEVPRYEKQSKRVKVKLWNPFRCWKEFDVKLWKREKCEEVGTELVEREVERSKQVVVGERDEVELVGYRTEMRIVAPARTETVRECVELPDEWVTLGPPGAAPLPGTTSVMTETQYKAILKTALAPAAAGS